MLLAGTAGAWMWTARPVPETAAMDEALRRRGRVALWGEPDLGRLAGDGTELVSVRDLPALQRALEGTDPAAVGRAMDGAGLAGLLVDTRDAGGEGGGDDVAARLRRYDHVPGLVGEYLAPAAALYLRREPVDTPPPLDAALAGVARGILEGKRPPKLQSFPGPLRRIRDVEVMVLLRQGARPRLWRSARGSSLARALVTAAVVARDRWQEREGAMGGSLDVVLPELTIEVSLLIDDGTLGDDDPAFLERALAKPHGAGYERKGTWRYLLPERMPSSAMDAFERLFRENGLSPEQAWGRPDVRLYRLVVHPLARSAP